MEETLQSDAQDMVTRVMPGLKVIHMLDSDLDHFVPEEFQHECFWTQILSFFVFDCGKLGQGLFLTLVTHTAAA